jgi:ribosomal protein S18 acetylase RimI-like enzyme
MSSGNKESGSGSSRSLIIRRIRKREIEECARLMSGQEPWLSLKRDFEESVEILSDPSRESYVATIEGRVTGFLILSMRGAFVGYLQTVCVAPGWRNQGIGRRLVAFAENRIFKEAPNVFLCVSSFNPDARRLYERLGYEFVGELKDYIIRGHSEILFRKTRGPLRESKKSDRGGNPET